MTPLNPNSRPSDRDPLPSIPTTTTSRTGLAKMTRGEGIGRTGQGKHVRSGNLDSESGHLESPDSHSS